MDLFDVAKACVRRWLIFLPLLAVTALFSYHSYNSVQPVYYGSTTLGLAGSSVQSEVSPGERRTNTLQDSGGLILLSNLMALGLTEASSHQQVAAQGVSSDYTAEMFTIPGVGQLPLVVISSTNPDPIAIKNTLQVAASQATTVIRGLQQNAGVPEDQMVLPYAVVPPGDPVQTMPSRTRSTLVIFVAGAGLSVLVTVLADVFLTKRKERRKHSAAAPSDNEGDRTPGLPNAYADQWLGQPDAVDRR